VDADKALYVVDGRQAAAPNVVFPYMTCALYRTYPPIQGIVQGEVEVEFHHPIWADQDTTVVARGEVLDKFERKGRRFVRWQETFHRGDGVLLARLTNTFHVPE
jgi:acyl-coenzyme A thioesterase PaaI-like protein